MDNTIRDLIKKSGRGEELTQADLDAFVTACPNVPKALRATVESLSACLAEVIPVWARVIAELLPQLTLYRALDQCPDHRVRHLALRAKKHRTRKKNQHRALKLLEKEVNP